MLNVTTGGSQGVLSCYDRIVITGTLPGVCYAKGMTSFLYGNAIRIFDYPQFAATLRDKVRENAAKVAEAAGEFPTAASLPVMDSMSTSWRVRVTASMGRE